MDDERLIQALRAGPSDEPLFVPTGAARERRVRAPSVRPRGLAGLSPIAGIAAAVLVAVLVLRPSSPAPAAGDLLGEVQAAGRLRVGVTNESPQLLVPGGTYAGFDLDVAQAIGQRLRLPVQIDLTDPAGIELGNWVGRWDLAFDSVASTERRAATLRVGAAYYSRAAAVIVRAGSPVAAVADLEGRTICVVREGLAERWLAGTLDLVGGRTAPTPARGEVTVAASIKECLDSVSNDAADAYVADWRFDVPSLTSSLVVLLDAPFVAEAAPAVDLQRPGSERLLGEIDRIVAAMRADGTLRTLSERRFGGIDLTSLPLP